MQARQSVKYPGRPCNGDWERIAGASREHHRLLSVAYWVSIPYRNTHRNSPREVHSASIDASDDARPTSDEPDGQLGSVRKRRWITWDWHSDSIAREFYNAAGSVHGHCHGRSWWTE
jgi:hypothetical protein